MSAETVVNALINAAQSIAASTINKALVYTDAAQIAAQSITDISNVPIPIKPSPVIPAFLPNPDEAEQKFRTNFAELFNQLEPEFEVEFNEFLARFFPQIDECLQSSIDTWLCNTINNGATGIPTDVENQIWERSRARELKDFGRRDDELVRTWANRGFSMPTGALFDAQQIAQEDLTEKISTHSRDVAIKQAEIQIETIKFAVAEGIKLRLGALDVAIKYLQVWLGNAQISVAYANATILARSHLYQALAAYYGALIASERLIYDWGHDQAVLTVEQDKSFVSLVNSNVTARVGAAIAAANAVGSIGAAAIAAQNSLASISNNTNITG